MNAKPSDRIESIHIVAAALDVERKRKKGTPKEVAEAQQSKDLLVKMWKKQLWARKTCPNCGAAMEKYQ